MDDYESGLLKTIELCNLIILNEGKQGFSKEQAEKAKIIKSEYQQYLEKYRRLDKEKALVKQTRAFSR